MNDTRSSIIKTLFSFVPYLLVSWAYMTFVNGKARQFWIAFAALIIIRLFFSVIETLGSVLWWRLYGKKRCVDEILRFLRENSFPKREYVHDDFSNYLARIQDGDSYAASIKNLAKEMDTLLWRCDEAGILAGMRMHSATDAALNVYSPKSEAPIFGSDEAEE